MCDVDLDFVLVRGPENVCRRLHVAVPSDGTPLTIGRALHCDVVLDPWLVFASQVQCSMFCVPDEGEACATVLPTEKQRGRGGEGEDAEATSANDGGCEGREQGEEVTQTPNRRPLPHESSGSSGPSAATVGRCPPAQQRICITDLCSSNGTFVNGVRVGSADAVEVRDGDTCIFGGMRDVSVGCALPDDAFSGPELVVWRVDMAGGKGRQPTQYPYEATPALLPTSEVLLHEEREILSTVLRSLRAAPLQQPGPIHSGEGSGGDGTTPASPAVLQQLFAGQTPATEPRRPHEKHDEPAVEAATLEEESDDEQRRSGTVAARLSGQLDAHPAAVVAAAETRTPTPARTPTPTPAPAPPPQSDADFFLLLNTLESPSNAPSVTEPPQPVHFHAVRVGRHTFHVPVPALLGAHMVEVAEATKSEEEEERGVTRGRPAKKRKGGAAAAATKRAKAETSLSPPPPLPMAPERLPAPVYVLHFTAAHWKWVMDNPNGDGCTRASLPAGLAIPPFHVMLPVTSIQSILVCRERLGVSVELKDGCQVPLVQPGVLDGAPENRWLVWMLEDCQAAPSTPEGQSKRITDSKSKRGGPVTNTTVGSADLSPANTTSLYESFDEWIAHMAAFYSAYKVPAPLAIDSDTFDKLFAPEKLLA